MIFLLLLLCQAGPLVGGPLDGQQTDAGPLPSGQPSPGHVAQPPTSGSIGNTLIILLDDVGVDQVGCYGSNYPSLVFEACTPNIDALAASGMRFTNAWASAVCSPARAQLVTGRPARYTGVGSVTEPTMSMPQNIGLQLDQPTFGDLLPGATSAVVGKWHLTDPYQDQAGIQNPVDLGFDSFSGTLYNLQQHYTFWQKVEYPAGTVTRGYPVYATTETTTDALALMSSLPEPWVLYVAYNSAHTPLHCPGEEGLDVPPGSASSCNTDWCAECVTNLTDPICAAYGIEACQSRAMVQAADYKLGQLLAAVDLESTTIFLSSDNGTARRPTVPPFDKDHGKGTVYQGGINVPLIVRTPGGLSGVNHELISLTDVYATLADLAGITPPPDPLRDSVSLAQYVAPARNLSGATPRTHVFSEFFGPNYDPLPSGAAPGNYKAGFDVRTMRNATHKLIEHRSWFGATGTCDVSLELYRLGDGPAQDPAFGPDPFEANDLMLTPTTWTHADMDAFIQLNTKMNADYPALQTGSCP